MKWYRASLIPRRASLILRHLLPVHVCYNNRAKLKARHSVLARMTAFAGSFGARLVPHDKFLTLLYSLVHSFHYYNAGECGVMAMRLPKSLLLQRVWQKFGNDCFGSSANSSRGGVPSRVQKITICNESTEVHNPRRVYCAILLPGIINREMWCGAFPSFES